jgi:prepilin-type N-terminal cleavage/methylation domain-containing protein
MHTFFQNRILNTQASMSPLSKYPRNTGFTLVELSIVLVILGLLVGGVLTGQSLIRAAELRSITTQHAAFTTAINAFRDKYFALPGDMTNATSFWGTNAGCATAAAGTGTQTCNGNGDGLMTQANPGGFQEQFYMWQHLANAGLIEGSYNGVGPTYYDCDKTRCPVGKISGSAWGVTAFGIDPGTSSWWWSDSSRNVFMFGLDAGGYPFSALLTPEDAWNIDKKVDDGLPGLGRWMSSGGGAYSPSCAVVAATGAALAATDYTKANASNIGYNLADKNIRCGFQIWW